MASDCTGPQREYKLPTGAKPTGPSAMSERDEQFMAFNHHTARAAAGSAGGCPPIYPGRTVRRLLLPRLRGGRPIPVAGDVCVAGERCILAPGRGGGGGAAQRGVSALSLRYLSSGVRAAAAVDLYPTGPNGGPLLRGFGRTLLGLDSCWQTPRPARGAAAAPRRRRRCKWIYAGDGLLSASITFSVPTACLYLYAPTL